MALRLSSLIFVLTLVAAVSRAAAPACAAVFSESDFPAAELRLSALEKLNVPVGLASVAVSYVPAQPGRPTILMLPGANRSLVETDLGFQALVDRGFGVASISFSAQPFSISGAKGKLSSDLKLQDFAREIETVGTFLKSRGVKNLIPVSLSYSGAATPYLKDFPVVVETAPMTSADAASPKAASYRSQLKAGAMMNPFFGQGMVRSMLDSSYASHWSAQAKTMVTQFKLPAAREKDFVSGYVAMTKAAEDSDWDKVTLPKDVRRVFILAQKEEPELRMHQVRTIERLRRDGYAVTTIVVEDAFHNVPNTEPEAFADVLALAQDAKNAGRVIVWTPVTDSREASSKTYSGSAADKILSDFGSRK